MKRVILPLLVVFVYFITLFVPFSVSEATTASAAEPGKLMRFADVHGDRIVFTDIKKDTRKASNKRDVHKDELPVGVRSRTIYGGKK